MEIHQVCKQCVMDTTDPDIIFDQDGICNHCHEYETLKNQSHQYTEQKFEEIVEKIKKRGKSYQYDCISALSGGTDSSYLLHRLKSYGLRVLAFHYDSGWNTQEAVHNVKALTSKMDVDLYTFTIDPKEFRAIQIAYLKAGVIDLDVPTDHALHGSMYKAAVVNKVPTIMTGHNFETESIMPKSWVTDKLDSRNLMDIYKQYGNGVPIKTFPLQTAWVKFMNYNIRNIKMIFALNYLEYNKKRAYEELKNEYGWEPVRVKHGESIWTRFYQCYVLNERFGVDKRKAHFSNLILSGVMTRDEALEELKKPTYRDDFEQDKQMILERYQLSEEDMKSFINRPIRKHSDFKNEKVLKNFYFKLERLLPFLNSSTKH